MSKLRALIIDDEPLAQEGVALLLKDEPDIEVIGICADGHTALAEIRAKRPDLAFLDVQLPRLNGFEILEQLSPEERPAVIFITAYDRYAINAFEASAVDYLLKPFRDNRFKDAISRAKERMRRATSGEIQRWAEQLLSQLKLQASAQFMPTTRKPESRLALRVRSDYVFVEQEDIVWIEAQGDSVRLSAGGEIITARESLQKIEVRLDVAKFQRVHRSFIVNVSEVKKITSALYGDYTLVMSDGVKIRLSRNYRDKLRLLIP